MNNLPFDVWTLKFHNIEHEDLFENFTDKVRLTVFKIITLGLSLLGFVLFIQFFIQQQSNILVILLSLNFAVLLLFYLARNKVIQFLKYINLLLYLGIVGGSSFIALSGFEIPLYLYGFCCSCVSLPLIQHGHYKMKIIIIIIIPQIQLLVFNSYSLHYLGFILLAYLSQVLLAVQLYYNEYFMRLSFSFYQINLRQREILEEFVNDPLVAVSFDHRTQQFQLEFDNQEFRKQFYDLDGNQIREFLRMIKIESNPIIQSSEMNSRKFSTKFQTLEEQCFALMNSDNQIWSSIYGKLQNFTKPIQNFNIEIKKVFLAKPILFILVKREKIAEIYQQNQQKISYYKNLINQLSLQIIEQSEKLQQKSTYQNCKQDSSELFELNQFRNFWILINNNIIKSQQLKVQKINLKHYLSNIKNYFNNLAKSYDSSFRLLNHCDENLHFTNSIKMLSQIIINIYEIALKNSKRFGIILLELRNQSFEIQNNCLSNQNSGNFAGEQLKEKFLIEFNISFFSERDFELKPKKQVSLNPRNQEDYQYNDEEFDIVWPVSCFALSRIGPYNEIQTRKTLFKNEVEKIIYHYSIIFQIYQDQTNQDESFLNYITGQS